MSDIKIAVITGANRGLGLASTKEFATNGWQVIGTGRSKRPTEFPDGATYQQFDGSDATACELFWKQLHDQYGDAEICLVNNAGGYVYGGLTNLRAEDYIQQLQSIYFTAVHMTRGLTLVVPKARIINVVSSSALAPQADELAYGAAKAAEKYFFQSLQEEFKPEQYQITNVYPSDIATHGANPEAINPIDLAVFMREQAENASSYYLRDVVMYPTRKEN